MQKCDLWQWSIVKRLITCGKNCQPVNWNRQVSNSSLSILWLSNYAQNNWKRDSGETMDNPNNIHILPQSLVFNCIVHGHSTRISKMSYSSLHRQALNKSFIFAIIVDECNLMWCTRTNEQIVNNQGLDLAMTNSQLIGLHTVNQKWTVTESWI